MEPLTGTVTTVGEVSVREVTVEALRSMESEQGGFNFENSIRNQHILSAAAASGALSRVPRAMKTGTTIVGLKYKHGVVLGADTRATNGTEVADKNCQKIHYIAPNIYCCGAGTAADTERTTEMISAQLQLMRLNTSSPSRVTTAHTLLKRMLFKYHGEIGAALLLGGVDVTGPHLYTIHPHGSSWELPYDTMGSGSLAAMAVFESRFQEDMEEADAVQLVKDAILAGIFNDLGSGSNVDVSVIRTDGTVTYVRGAETPNDVSAVKAQYTTPARAAITLGATVVIKEEFVPHSKVSAPLVVATADEGKMEDA